MALTPADEVHALQIQAGSIGRAAGHTFESALAEEINALTTPYVVGSSAMPHLNIDNPGKSLIGYICKHQNITKATKITAISTGALATSEEGKKWLLVNGVGVARCKSDVVITICDEQGKAFTVGVSTKQCNNKNPTNAQLYFTTARGFSNLLINNGIPVSQNAIDALRQFCGENGFRPIDDESKLKNRRTDPRRFFWEEISALGRQEWESIFKNHQDDITRLLLQKAYLNDPFVPEYIMHKTKKAPSWEKTEVAIYSVDELILLSRKYQGFAVKEYSVKKGSYKDPTGIRHQAPRFGIVQMQRGGQQQHPEQLQFNLEASYFYKLSTAQ
jgi:hypothetical protein